MNQSLQIPDTPARTRLSAALAIAFVSTVTALGLALITRELADIWALFLSPFFYLAVIVAARRAGMLAGAAASLFSLGALSFLAWGPEINSSVLTVSHVRLAFFLGISLTIAGFAAANRARERELLTSRRNLADFIDNAPLGLLWVSPDGIILLANKAELTMLGYDAGEYVGHHVSEFHADGDSLQTLLQHLKDGEPLHDHRARVRARDRTIREVLIDSNALWRDGVLVHIRCSTRDITERARAEHSLSVLARTNLMLGPSLDFKETLDSLADLLVPELADWCALYLIDGKRLRRMTLRHRDPALAEMTRAQENRVRSARLPAALAEVVGLGSRLRRNLTEADIAAISGRRRREIIARLGLCSQIMVPLRSGDRSVGIIIMSMGPSGRHYDEEDLKLAEEVGRRAGLTIENARLYHEAQRVQEELSHANQAKDEFLALLSHELRTAVSAIWGTSRTLSLRRSDLDAETNAALLESVEHESGKLHRLIENLLTLARSEAGQEAPKEPIAIRPLIARLLSDLAQSGYRRPVELRLEGVTVVDAEPTYLEQILQNLVANADKYAPDGTPVELVVSRERNEVLFRVLDRGPGIAAGEADLIFESFYRSERTASAAPGKGLGLTVCKRLVQAQGGRIWARPRVEGGLEVGFALPMVYDGDGESLTSRSDFAPDTRPTRTLRAPDVTSVSYP